MFVNNKTKILALVCALGLIACNKGPQPGTSSKTSSAEAKGAELMQTKCLVCHGKELIEQQRLAKTGWTREVEKMTRWGAEIGDADKDPLVEYLSNHYGPRPLTPSSPQPMPAQAAVDHGAELFKAKCLVCHGPELVEQQRLARAGWVREVEKMMRWGAEVSDADKDHLADFLFKNYGPRKLMAKS